MAVLKKGVVPASRLAILADLLLPVEHVLHEMLDGAAQKGLQVNARGLSIYAKMVLVLLYLSILCVYLSILMF